MPQMTAVRMKKHRFHNLPVKLLSFLLSFLCGRILKKCVMTWSTLLDSAQNTTSSVLVYTIYSTMGLFEEAVDLSLKVSCMNDSCGKMCWIAISFPVSNYLDLFVCVSGSNLRPHYLKIRAVSLPPSWILKCYCFTSSTYYLLQLYICHHRCPFTLGGKSSGLLSGR